MVTSPVAGSVSATGQRDSLALVVHTQDDELARLGALRNIGRLDLHQRDGAVEGSGFGNTVHTLTPFDSIAISDGGLTVFIISQLISICNSPENSFSDRFFSFNADGLSITHKILQR